MARTTTDHQIVVVSADKFGVVRKEALADEALYPGMLARFDADEELEAHATANGVLVGKLVVLETLTPNTDTYPTTAAIDIPYTIGDTCYYVEGQPGDVLNMFLANGETAVKGVSQLISNGDGSLKVETVDADTLANSIVGVAAADLANATGSRARLRVTIT